MAKVTLFLLLGSFALASPIQSTQNTISVPGVGEFHWPQGRPHPVKVTQTPSGQHLAWVKREDQLEHGSIAEPPAPPKLGPVRGRPQPTPELEEPGVETGPEGTVPFQLIKKDALSRIPTKGSPLQGSSRLETRSGNGHYYGNSNQATNNYGGSCYLSLFQPAVSSSGSMSLIQIAVANTQQVQQTAESGWQVLPVLNGGDYRPHIFSYFTTNGYAQEGDNLGGYNTQHKGFVQTSSTYYPGMTFSSISTVGGTQYEVPLSFQYKSGNWWLSVNGNQLGYFPGSIYAKGGTTTNTLGDHANNIGYFGEIYENPAVNPTSDMGSGKFANTGFGQAAYMHNLVYYPTTALSPTNYNGGTSQSNSSWYTINPHFNSGESWASYFYVGGPGAG